MTSDTFRWQAAMGAAVGALLASADPVCLSIAERSLRGEPLPIDLTPEAAIPAAVGLAVGATPLLTDPTTAALVDHIRAWLDGDAGATTTDDRLAAAIEWSRQGAAPWLDTDDIQVDPVLRGAVTGLEVGIGGIAARQVVAATSEVRGGRRYLSRLTARLLGIDRIELYDPRQRRGPREVLDGLWLSNLFGVKRFAEDHPDGLVLSLCDDEGRLDDHADHLTFHLDDTPRNGANPSLDFVLDDVLAEVRAAQAKGQPVLVHCRHGASRTGLILRLLVAEENGLDAEDALTEAECIWPHTSSWNNAWNRKVAERTAQNKDAEPSNEVPSPAP